MEKTPKPENVKCSMSEHVTGVDPRIHDTTPGDVKSSTRIPGTTSGDVQTLRRAADITDENENHPSRISDAKSENLKSEDSSSEDVKMSSMPNGISSGNDTTASRISHRTPEGDQNVLTVRVDTTSKDVKISCRTPDTNSEGNTATCRPTAPAVDDMGRIKSERRTNSIEHPWGWLVTAAAFIIHLLSYGFSWSSGVLNAIFLDTFDSPAVDVSWVGTLIIGNMFTSGALAGFVCDRLGYRVTAFIGGGLTSAGMIMSYFSPNIYFLYFSLGVVSGIGGGLSFLPSIAAVTHYFDKRRSLALGITSAGLGFGQFVFPGLIRWLYMYYDWRGVLLILGGICLNICVCGAVFRPIKTGDTNAEEARPKCHCNVFFNPGYICMCVNNILICFGLSIVYIHLPAYGEFVGIDEVKSALLMSAMGLANVIGRVSFGVFDHYLKTRSCILYGGAFGLSGIVVALMPTTSNYVLLISLAVFFGFFTGCFGVLLAVIMAKLVGLERFAAGYGYILLFEGIGTLGGGPVAGFLYDVTKRYDVSLYSSGACLTASALLMIIPHQLSKARLTDDIEQTIETQDH